MKSFEESFVIEQDTDNNTIEIIKNDLNPRNLKVIYISMYSYFLMCSFIIKLEISNRSQFLLLHIKNPWIIETSIYKNSDSFH